MRAVDKIALQRLTKRPPRMYDILMKKDVQHIVQAEIIDVFLLFAGCVIAVIIGAAGIVPNEYYIYSVGVGCIIELCFYVVIVLVEIISVFKISDSTWHTLFIAASLLVYHLTGVDMTRFIGNFGAEWYVKIADAFNFLSFCLAVCALINFWNYTFKTNLPRKFVVSVIVAAIVCPSVYVAVDFFGLGIIAYCLFMAAITPTFVYIYNKIHSEGNNNSMFIATKAVFFTLAGAALTTNVCTAFSFPANGFPVFQELPVIIVFLSIYAAFAMRTDREALKASEYRLQYERVKSQALREQIKPHFIFNTLAAIQSLYHEDVEEGDRAINLFSRHLRTNIEASNTDFIPFDKELDNIQVYIDLENMRLSDNIEVIFDIDYTDFSVPMLSLQPYIENAIKHSHINEREDGFIRISSQLTDDGIEVEIADNGVGFDTNSIPSSSCGIRNSSERFYLLMGVTPEIISAPDMGTTVKIKFKGDNRAAFGANKA